MNIGELASNESGRRYLRWLAENDASYAGTAARIVLGLDGHRTLQPTLLGDRDECHPE
jgi:hypothetical protein